MQTWETPSPFMQQLEKQSEGMVDDPSIAFTPNCEEGVTRDLVTGTIIHVLHIVAYI